ncbi:terminase [Sesbania bispinosa]|nr:terminase [Sesbania bispinosa]
MKDALGNYLENDGNLILNDMLTNLFEEDARNHVINGDCAGQQTLEPDIVHFNLTSQREYPKELRKGEAGIRDPFQVDAPLGCGPVTHTNGLDIVNDKVEIQVVGWSNNNQKELPNYTHPLSVCDPSSNGPDMCVDGLDLSPKITYHGEEDLFGDSRLCEVPITMVEDFVALGLNLPEASDHGIDVGHIKRMRGRPRKNSAKLNVSDCNLDPNLDPLVVRNYVWKNGLDLGVTGVMDESEMIERLPDMEKRD